MQPDTRKPVSPGVKAALEFGPLLVFFAVFKLMKDRTVIVIAHRLSTIRHAACILVMDQGRIVQKGGHDDLMRTSELYARLASYHFNQ